MNTVKVLERVAETWNQLGVQYAVAHGLEEYPSRVGRDLDVLVAMDDVGRAFKAAQETLIAAGFEVGVPHPIWGVRLVAGMLAGYPILLELHLITAIRWRNLMLAGRPAPNSALGPFHIDPWVSFAKRILMPLLAGSADGRASVPNRFCMAEAERVAVREPLMILVGQKNADELLAALAENSIGETAALISRIRPWLVRRAWYGHPLRSARLITISGLRRLIQPFAPCGPIVAVIGSSTHRREILLTELANGDRLVFTACVLRRLTRDEKGPPSPVIHWVRLFGLLARAMGLALYKDRFDSSRQRLVLYDGWPSEAGVRPHRYSLRSARGAALLSVVLPKPDLLLIVDSQAGSTSPPGHTRTLVLDSHWSDEEAWRFALSGIARVFLMKQRGRVQATNQLT